MVSLPAVMFLEPRMVPVPLLAASLMLSIIVLAREHHALDKRGFGWALGARVIGTVAAILLIPSDVTGEYRWVLGAILLIAAALSATDRFVLKPNSVTLSFAGLLSGLMGTSTSVGGPAMGLVYRREELPRLRSTLAAYFIAGNTISLVALAIAGRFGATELRLSALTIPAVLIGERLGRPIGTMVSEKTLRGSVLLLVVVGGTIALAQGI